MSHSFGIGISNVWAVSGGQGAWMYPGNTLPPFDPVAYDITQNWPKPVILNYFVIA